MMVLQTIALANLAIGPSVTKEEQLTTLTRLRRTSYDYVEVFGCIRSLDLAIGPLPDTTADQFLYSETETLSCIPLAQYARCYNRAPPNSYSKI